MKNKILLILVLIILAINVSAGEVKNIGFSEDIKQQILTISSKDRIDFDLVDGTHTIIINKLTNDKIDLDIFRYINLDSETRAKEYPVGYVYIHPGEQINLDLNQDKYNDLNIRILNLNNYETTLLFTKIHECIFSNPETCEKQQEESNNQVNNTLTGFSIKKITEKINKTGVIITLLIMIIGLIIFFISKKSKPSNLSNSNS